jgi:predicted metal-binding protein
MNEQFKLNERYTDKIKELGAIWAKYISPIKVVTAEWTRLKCQYGCFNYGRFVCPPHTPDALTMRRILDCYQVGLMFQFSGKWEPQKNDDQLDEKGRATRALWHEEKERKRFNDALVALEYKFFFDGYYKAFGLGSGPCLICGLKCNPQGPCTHPYEARPSMEACGIDVYLTVRNLGIELSPLNHPEAKFSNFGLILIE